MQMAASTRHLDFDQGGGNVYASDMICIFIAY
jgi:hypothetical protein